MAIHKVNINNSYIAETYKPPYLFKRRMYLLSALLFGSLALTGNDLSAKPHNQAITFDNIANDTDVGIDYRRQPSLSNALWLSLKQQSIYSLTDMVNTPTKPRGIPGLAALDYDADGDIDIYVTNGPGVANSLYANQFSKTGQVTFVEVAAQAGVEAINQDSSGVCFGDIDNDGDQDLYVLGKAMPNKLFQNNGQGTFVDITESADIGGGNRSSSTCSFGDVNGDGLLDLAVSNLFDGTEQHRLPIILHGFEDLEQHNQLFINQGNNTFSDESLSSGINNEAGISWSLALVDYDLDGDLDMVVADDQGARKPGHVGGSDIGKLRMYSNNGKGKFRDVTDHLNGGRFGAWMGVSFGDLNHDGHMDIFASNIGDYMALFMQPLVDYPVRLKEWSTGWFLGQEDGGFSFYNSFDELGVLPFGWGSAITDYDNDGDQDIIYHGGLDMGSFVDASNPGAVLRNDSKGKWSRDTQALQQTDHSRRNVNGFAVADLNNDGFVDFISVSNQNWPAAAPLIPYIQDPSVYVGGPFDDVAFFAPTFTPVNPLDLTQGFTWNGIEPENGNLVIELNSANNRNHSVSVKLMGTKNMTSAGVVNYDGIGAVVSFVSRKGEPVMSPVLSGGTYASQHSLELIFGMGKSKKGIVEVLWPGGVRNRLYKVKRGEKLVLPEIPCSFDDVSIAKEDYKHCVKNSLNELKDANKITKKEMRRLYKSAIRAYGDSNLYDINNSVQFSDESEELDFQYLTVATEGLSGAAWLDYDSDNDLDLYLTNGRGQKNALFQNNGDGEFTDISANAQVQNGLGNSGVLAGDIDNDGYPDLFLSSDGGMVTPVQSSEFKLYHNNGNGSYTDITASSGITGLITSFSSAFGDINNDGYIDLLVSTPGSIPLQRQDRNKLYLNNGDLTFTDVSAVTGIDTALGGCLASFTDYDLDGDQDIVIGNCNDIRFIPGPIELFRNDGGLNFVNVTQSAGLTRQGGWMGLTIADYDNDGDPDIFSTNLGMLPRAPAETTATVLYENNGDGTFTDVDMLAGVRDQIWGWGSTFTDFTNDGHTDLFYAGSFPFNFLTSVPNPGKLYINNRDKSFNDKSEWLGVDLTGRFVSGVASADYDNDGFADLVIAAGAASVDGNLGSQRLPGKPVLLRNRGNDKNAITIKTVGTKSNAGGIGARVMVQTDRLIQTKEVRAGSSFLSTESPWLNFGLNKHEQVDKIEVHWPSGVVESYQNLDVNRMYTITEGQGISSKKYAKGEDDHNSHNLSEDD